MAQRNPVIYLKETTMRKLFKPALLLATVGVLAFGLLSSGAWFTDTATSNTATISSGTLSIADGQVNTLPIGTIANMAPGDVTPDAEIIIQNNGTLDLAWFGNLIVGGDTDLKNAIYIDYAQMEFLSPGSAPNWEPTDNFIANGVGAGPYPAWFNSLAALSAFDVVTLDVFDGNNGMGSTPWEFMGALKPGYSYKLTLRFGFAGGAGNTYQNQGPMTISLQVDATQIASGALDAVQAGFGTTHLTWLNQQIAKQP
jgi:hypothetical protein